MPIIENSLLKMIEMVYLSNTFCDDEATVRCSLLIVNLVNKYDYIVAKLVFCTVKDVKPNHLIEYPIHNT